MAKNKNKSNEQVLRNMLSNLNTYEVAILRERIIASCDEALKNEEELKKSMAGSMFHPDWYLGVVKKIKAFANNEVADKPEKAEKTTPKSEKK